MHKPILLQNLSLSFSSKDCFLDFNARILSGNRIGIIGRNGSGKSSLLNILQNKIVPTEGKVIVPKNVQIGYLAQQIRGKMSGGECFNQALNDVLSKDPDILLLDEPTNHLDKRNRHALFRLLNNFKQTLVVVSHDVELLRRSIDIIWHIDLEKIHVFQGHYDDYIRECEVKRTALMQDRFHLNQQKKEMHRNLMQEQQRAAKSRKKGEKNIDNRKWATIGSKAKAARAVTTSSKKKSVLRNKKQDVVTQLSELYIPDVINPLFSLSGIITKKQTLLTISEGKVGYHKGKTVLSDIHLSIASGDRVALCGDNGSGKSTLLKAILDDPNIIKSGEWIVPKLFDVGYLDQHYANLIDKETVLESIEKLVVTWSASEIRHHLANFLFFSIEEVSALTFSLSEGEKARLCLAQLAALPPKLLILDEITNNLDLEHRAHIEHVLKVYPGTLLVISHDENFLSEIGITSYYYLANGGLQKMFFD